MAKFNMPSLDLDGLEVIGTPAPTNDSSVANKKYIDDKVKTPVPVNAKFTDTTYDVVTTSTDGIMSSTDKQDLDANTSSRHTHINKAVIDKFSEVDNRPYYNGAEIGGSVPNLTLNELTLGGRFRIVYNDVKDSLDVEVIY